MDPALKTSQVGALLLAIYVLATALAILWGRGSDPALRFAWDTLLVHAIAAACLVAFATAVRQVRRSLPFLYSRPRVPLSAGDALAFLGVMIAWGLEGNESDPTALTNVPVLGGGDAEDKLTPGARVITSDGRLVGRVTQASQDSPLVKAGWIPTRYGYLARSAIDHIEEGAIILALTEQQVRERGNVDTTPAGPVTNRAVTNERGVSS